MKAYFFTILVVLNSNAFATEPKFNSKNLVKAYDALVLEIERLNGDGLDPRSNRKKTFKQISKELRKDLVKTKNKKDAGRIFARLDAAYTNMHSYADVSSEYSYKNGEGALQIGISFHPENLTESGEVVGYRISNVREAMFKEAQLEKMPQVGDEIIEINGQSMKKWSDENFEYCKFPLKSQCELGFFDHFRGEYLSWYRKQELKITVKREGQRMTYTIPVGLRPKKETEPNAAQKSPCEVSDGRYQDYKLTYKGYNACVYENTKQEGLAVLRLISFRYRNVPESFKMKSVFDEAAQFNKKYWSDNSKKLKTFFIDVVENYGGDTVVPWVELFAKDPFQDQFVQFKNIKEFSEEKWRNAALYDDPGKIAVINKWKSEGYYEKVKVGEFFKAMPQFCSAEDDKCLTEKWKPKGNNFGGRYILITDNWCISSCAGFVWTMKNTLGSQVQVAGVPDSADTTYTRASIELRLTDKAPYYTLTTQGRNVGGHKNVEEKAVVKQVVSVSRSTDENGNIVSGRPVKMDFFIAQQWNENFDQWVNRVLAEVSAVK